MNSVYALMLVFNFSVEAYNAINVYMEHIKELRIRKIEASLSYNVKQLQNNGRGI